MLLIKLNFDKTFDELLYRTPYSYIMHVHCLLWIKHVSLREAVCVKRQ